MTRSEKIFNNRIDCPKHGTQKTFTLYKDNGKIAGISCAKCYEHLKVLK